MTTNYKKIKNMSIEEMAYEIVRKYNLLSPIYKYFPRGGCWFCPNARDKELLFLKKNYPELWNKLLNLPKENLAFARFNRTETISEIDKRLNEIIEAEKMQLKLF